MAETAVMTQEQRDAAVLERVVIAGDLSKLEPEHRVLYYRSVCESLGLNPLTKPFAYITLNNKLTLYATRTATDQLRALKGISIDRLDHDEVEGLYIVTVYGHDGRGRTDSEVGAVPIAGLKGEARANAVLKAVTKAKRRLTLSLAGLGWLDETEVGSVPSAQAADVDLETGEIQRSLHEQVAARREAVTTNGGGRVTTLQADGVDDDDVDDPGPAEPAGARAATSTEKSSSPDSGTSGQPGTMPAPDDSGPASGPGVTPFAPGPDAQPARCEGFHIEHGACRREPGHTGNHQNADKESWK